VISFSFYLPANQIHRVKIAMQIRKEYPTIVVIKAFEIKKSTYYRHLNKRSANTSHQTNRSKEEKDQELLKEIKILLKEHPLWG